MPKRKGDESEASREMRQKRNKRERGRTEKLKKLYLELREELGDKNLERKTNKIRTLDAALGFVCQHEGKVEGRSIEPISMLPTPPPHPPPQVAPPPSQPEGTALGPDLFCSEEYPFRWPDEEDYFYGLGLQDIYASTGDSRAAWLGAGDTMLSSSMDHCDPQPV